MRYFKFTLFSIFLTLFSLLNIYGYELDDSVTIKRDYWGIPHIYSENEEALFFGAGYAAAEDRLLQMILTRYSIQGRLSEIFGRNYLNHDKKIRTIGFYRHAQRTLQQLNDTTIKLLESYAAGVNRYINDHPEHLEGLFQKLNGQPEQWKAEDCIAAMSRIAERFDGGWTNEVSALRKFEPLEAQFGRDSAIRILEINKLNVDNNSAIVSWDEYNKYDQKLKEIKTSESIDSKKGKEIILDHEWEAPKMSHNWVVSGERTTTGYPILESDPQISVESPATWYEFHLHGGRFNVRGISMPGSPGMLIGFNDKLSWGLTALGSDNADLFLEKMKSGSRDEYEWKGEYLKLEEFKEVIKVKDGEDVILTIKSTHHGPIVNEFLNGVKDGETFALKYLNNSIPETSLEALLIMMASNDWNSFSYGMSKYISPGTHLIYADKYGNIAYRTFAMIPVRAHKADIPFIGWTGDEEWRGIVPFDSMPRILNPDKEFISTANNLPIGNWYPYDIGGGIGDNARSKRLTELLSEDQSFSIESFLEVHRDATNTISRDFVKFSLMAVEAEKPNNPIIDSAVSILKDWDYKLLTDYPGYQLVSIIDVTIKRSLRGTPMETKYLGGDAGLMQLFDDLQSHLDTTGQLIEDNDIRTWLLDQLVVCYNKSGIASSGSRPFVLTHKMKYQNNLEGFGSLDPRSDIESPPLKCGVVGTIWSQLGNSYSQIVSYSDVDSSLAVIPPGNSEVPSSKYFRNQEDLWVNGQMRPAPLSVKLINMIIDTSYTLIPGTTDNQEYSNDEELIVYPNPSNCEVILHNLNGIESIHIFNQFGKLVKCFSNPTTNSFVWNFRDEAGLLVSPGPYFIEYHVNRYIKTKKVIFFK